jgi:hypothetical protein
MLGHPRRRTETQTRTIWIDNVQSNSCIAADLPSRLLSHRTEHHTYRSPADCEFERQLLGGQSPLASVQWFAHALFRIHIAAPTACRDPQQIAYSSSADWFSKMKAMV